MNKFTLRVSTSIDDYLEMYQTISSNQALLSGSANLSTKHLACVPSSTLVSVSPLSFQGDKWVRQKKPNGVKEIAKKRPTNICVKCTIKRVF